MEKNTFTLLFTGATLIVAALIYFNVNQVHSSIHDVEVAIAAEPGTTGTPGTPGFGGGTGSLTTVPVTAGTAIPYATADTWITNYYNHIQANPDPKDTRAYNINTDLLNAMKIQEGSPATGQAGLRTYFALPSTTVPTNVWMVVYPVDYSGTIINYEGLDLYVANVSGPLYSRPCPDYCDMVNGPPH